MKLKSLISLINADETVHIIKQSDSIYFGTIRNAYSELSNEFMENAKVTAIFTGLGGLCVEIVV